MFPITMVVAPMEPTRSHIVNNYLALVLKPNQLAGPQQTKSIHLK